MVLNCLSVSAGEGGVYTLRSSLATRDETPTPTTKPNGGVCTGQIRAELYSERRVYARVARPAEGAVKKPEAR